VQVASPAVSLHLKINLLVMFSESPLVKKLYDRLSHKVKVVSQEIEHKVQNTLGDRSNLSQRDLNQPTYLDEMLILQTLKTIENKAKERMEQSD
jgi:hypothetical protein